MNSRRPYGGFGDADPELQATLDAKLNEIRDAYYEVDDSIGVVASAQDAAHGLSVSNAMAQTWNTYKLLSGDLRSAVLGEHVFPLDDGTEINQQAALDVWNNLAESAQTTLNGIMSYEKSWGPWPSLKKGPEAALQKIKDPLSWPWYVQAAAGAAILYYGLSFMGVVGTARTALGRRSRRSRR